jgi:hypothetical protein
VKLLGVEALCSDKLAMSISSFTILKISFAHFSSDTVSLNSNFSLILHSHSNLLSSDVLYVKFEIATSYVTTAKAILFFIVDSKTTNIRYSSSLGNRLISLRQISQKTLHTDEK